MADPNSTATFADTAASVGLPPLLSRRHDVYAYYRLEFLADGYPGRRTESGLNPHPLYGTYVISDYLAQHRVTKDERYLDAAKTVADAAIARMERHEDSLVFWYTPEGAISSLPRRFYSALTQARYLQALVKLHRRTGDERYAEAARGIFRSLKIPVDRGGVMRSHGSGVVIEEYPHDYPDYTLNGWTTAMLLVEQYGRSLPDPEAQSFFAKNMEALRELLPLYDVPELANTRYRLTGPAAVRFGFDEPGVSIDAASVVIPGFGSYSIARKDTGKWQNRFRKGLALDGTVESQPVSAQVYLSVLSKPLPNAIHLTVTASKTTNLTVAIGQDRYRPLAVYLVPTRFVELSAHRLARGTAEIDVEVPWSEAELVAYPTNFGKPIGGVNFNQYHFIHVENLERLYDLTRDPVIGDFATKWRKYPSRWPSIPDYQGADISYTQYGK